MRITVALCVVLALCAPGGAHAAPAGQITWGVHVTIAPTWFDPAETPGIVTPFMLGNFPYSSPYEDLKLKGE